MIEPVDPVRLILAAAQTRIAAHLAQLQQRIEDGDAGALQAALRQCIAHSQLHLHPDGFIQIALRTGQFDAQRPGGARWQLGGDIQLAPTQQEWGDAPLQGGRGGTVGVLLDGATKPLLERFGGP